MPEWLNGAVSKTVRGPRVPRGFESHPLRLKETLLLLHPKAGAVVGLLWALRVIATTRREASAQLAPLLPLVGQSGCRYSDSWAASRASARWRKTSILRTFPSRIVKTSKKWITIGTPLSGLGHFG